MSHAIGIICFYGGTLSNTDNGITYNRGSNEFLTTLLKLSLNELSKMSYD
jgi:hypothetical protein